MIKKLYKDDFAGEDCYTKGYEQALRMLDFAKSFFLDKSADLALAFVAFTGA